MAHDRVYHLQQRVLGLPCRVYLVLPDSGLPRTIACSFAIDYAIACSFAFAFGIACSFAFGIA